MIPCYNEEVSIGSVVLKAKQYVDEVVVVDDGSIDDSVSIAKWAGANVISHGGNRGYGAAMKTCFKYARDNDFDVLTVLDGDGQHDADSIPTVMNPVLEKKVDVSIGSRFLGDNGGNVPRYRRFGNSVITKVTNVGAKKKHRVFDTQSGFRAYSKKAIGVINPMDFDMGACSEILLQGSKKNLEYEEVPIDCRYDVDGSTKKPVNHGIGVIISIFKFLEIEHSLLFFGVPGFIMFMIGLIFGLNVLLVYNESGFFPFGPSIISAVLLMIGMLSGVTGLILHAVINANRRDYRRHGL